MNDDRQNLSESQEDYLEAIYDLLRSGDTATVSEIAKRLGVAKPSVVKALKRLRELELITQKPYADINLTLAGRERAELIRLRHNTLVYFLKDFLGVNKETAETDACALEHHLSECSTERFLAFIDLNEETATRVVEGENFEIGSFIIRTNRRARKETDVGKHNTK
jgi:DtxR family Mn-dependent transcriptional regulator